MVQQKTLLRSGCVLLALLGSVVSQAAAQNAAGQPVVKIAVFDFELQDSSPGGGIIAQDAHDTRYLAEATEMAERLLVESGRYSLVETEDAGIQGEAPRGIRNCDGCEAPAAQKLGAEQAMIGVVNRISRAEYTLAIRVSDAETGQVLSNDFTNLRMGSNDSWPRAVRSLMRQRMLANPAAN
ncbi:MAG: DUF3280 domain-containing protein [Propylenella sp.]